MKDWDRRRFLGALAGTLPAWLALPSALRAWEGSGPSGARVLAPPASGPSTGSTPRATLDALPPRVVGLRTDGGNFRFDPDGLVISPGDAVVWLNMGDFHSTTAFHPDNGKLIGGELPLRIPEGAEPWHSGMLGLTDGTEFAHTFTVGGVYDYFCQPHYMFGMVGRIVVGAPHGGPGTRAMDGLPDVVRKRMPALDLMTGAALRPNEWASRLNGALYLRATGAEAADASARLRAAMEADEDLEHQAASRGRRRALRAALARFVESVSDGTDYEQLVSRADDVKLELARLASPTG